MRDLLRYAIPVLLGRLARALARRRGGGSAIPGRVVLALAPDYLTHAVEHLPLGVAVVTGSNGKSTTTSMLVAVLRAHGLRVFTNSAGGNLPQGVASALVGATGLDGRLDADIAVVEVDEGFGPALATTLAPRLALLLNIQIDQLNRFFEPDRVFGMLTAIARSTSQTVVLNNADDNLRELAASLIAESREVLGFDVADSVLAASAHGVAAAERVRAAATDAPNVATVAAVTGETATIALGTDSLDVALPARGLHYAVDAAGALVAAQRLLGGDFDPAAAERAFASFAPVYGRGEVIEIHGEPTEIVMFKNPPSLQLNLDALEGAPERLFLAVDEGTPDPSWIWGIDWSRIDHVDVLAGTKAWQFATLFAYLGIPIAQVVEDLDAAVDAFWALPAPESPSPRVALVNYEIMMWLRRKFGYLEIEGAK